MSKVQNQKPTRTCDKTYANYGSFKSYLRNDFNQRCGYCDDNDFYSGGSRGYHIDHFKPHSKFPLLKQTYSNLVYSCPYCNGAKSNKWKTLNGFIDPCELEYDNHLERDKKGKIKFKTVQGKYIFQNLNLGLKRHELLWCINKLTVQKEKINYLINSEATANIEILSAFRDIQNKIDEYTDLFQGEI